MRIHSGVIVFFSEKLILPARAAGKAKTAFPMALSILSLLLSMQSRAETLLLREGSQGNSLSVFRTGQDKPILTQNAAPDFRPYIHPIVAPDGNR